MNKGELVEAVSGKVGDGVSRKEVENTVNAVLDTIKESLAKGEGVQLTGFGSFEVRKRGARKGRNPQTGQPMKIAASKSPAFKAGKGLKDAVNSGGSRRGAAKKAGAKKAAKKSAKKAGRKTAKKAAKKR